MDAKYPEIYMIHDQLQHLDTLYKYAEQYNNLVIKPNPEWSKSALYFSHEGHLYTENGSQIPILDDASKRLFTVAHPLLDNLGKFRHFISDREWLQPFPQLDRAYPSLDEQEVDRVCATLVEWMQDNGRNLEIGNNAYITMINLPIARFNIHNRGWFSVDEILQSQRTIEQKELARQVYKYYQEITDGD